MSEVNITADFSKLASSPNMGKGDRFSKAGGKFGYYLNIESKHNSGNKYSEDKSSKDLLSGDNVAIETKKDADKSTEKVVEDNNSKNSFQGEQLLSLLLQNQKNNTNITTDNINVKTGLNEIDESTLIQNKIPTGEVQRVSSKQKSSTEEINLLNDVLSELQSTESGKAAGSNTSVLENKLISNNNNSAMLQNLILDKLNSMNASDEKNKNMDKTESISAKDKLINDIKQELNKLISLQNQNVNATSQKQNNLSINDTNIIADSTNVKTDLNEVDGNTLIQNKISTVESQAKSVSNSDIDTKNVSTFGAEIFSDKETAKPQTSEVQQASSRQELNTQEISVLNDILSGLQSIESGKTGDGNTSVLENKLMSNNNDSSILQNLILDKLNPMNASDKSNKNTDKTEPISAEDKLINDIKQELNKLISLQNQNVNATSQKQNNLSTNDTNIIADSTNIKTGLNEVDGNTLIQNKISTVESQLQSVSTSEVDTKNVSTFGAEIFSGKETAKLQTSEVQQASSKQELSSQRISLLNDILSKLQKIENGKAGSSNTSALENKLISNNNNFGILQDLILDKLNSMNASDEKNKNIDKTEFISAEDKLIKYIKQELNKLISLQNQNVNTISKKQNNLSTNDTNIISDSTNVKTDLNEVDGNTLIQNRISTVESQPKSVSTSEIDTKNVSTLGKDTFSGKEAMKSQTSEVQQASSKQELNTQEISVLKDILSGLQSIKSDKAAGSKPSVLENKLISNNNNSAMLQNLTLDKLNFVNQYKLSSTQEIKNILSKTDNLHSDAAGSPSKLLSVSDNMAQNKDNEFLNKLIDNKDSEDKYLKVINVMNQFTVNNGDISNQNVQPTVINKANFAQDLIKSLSYMENNNVKSMTVKIMPNELGEVFIKITSDGSIMKATITATNKDSYNLLNSNLHEINSTLNSQHIKIQSLDINIYNGDTTYFSGNNDFSSNQFNNHGKNESRSSNNGTAGLSNIEELLDINSENNFDESNNVNVLV